MSEQAQKYIELVEELAWRRATWTLSPADEVRFVGELDRLWRELPESEQDAIDEYLVHLDAHEGEEPRYRDVEVRYGEGVEPREPF